MKKIFSIIWFSLILLLAACGNVSTTNDYNSNASSTNAEKSVNNVVVDESNEQDEVIVEKPKIQTISVNETVIVEDFAEITIKGNKFGKRIDPPNPGSFYSYYENKEQEQIFLDTVILVKSLLTSGKSSDEFVNVKIIYDDKYEYTTFSTIEDKGGADFTYTNITNIEPLKSGMLHFLASVPIEVETDGKPLKAVITVNGNEYEQIIR